MATLLRPTVSSKTHLRTLSKIKRNHRLSSSCRPTVAPLLFLPANRRSQVTTARAYVTYFFSRGAAAGRRPTRTLLHAPRQGGDRRGLGTAHPAALKPAFDGRRRGREQQADPAGEKMALPPPWWEEDTAPVIELEEAESAGSNDGGGGGMVLVAGGDDDDDHRFLCFVTWCLLLLEVARAAPKKDRDGPSCPKKDGNGPSSSATGRRRRRRAGPHLLWPRKGRRFTGMEARSSPSAINQTCRQDCRMNETWECMKKLEAPQYEE